MLPRYNLNFIIPLLVLFNIKLHQMKNILKIWLNKNQLTVDPIEYNAQVVIKGNVGTTDIVDELLKEGIEVDREALIDIINRFNRKSVDLVLSGYNVNTGLVNMRSTIKGSILDGKWNSNINWVNVGITPGNDLYQAVANTTVEILGEKDEKNEIFNHNNQRNLYSESHLNNVRIDDASIQHKIVNEPACGIAFRRWLCKA